MIQVPCSPLNSTLCDNEYAESPDRRCVAVKRHQTDWQSFCVACAKRDMKLLLSVILWCALLALCWPIALLVLFLFPIAWLILLPFKVVGLTIDLVFKLTGAILMFPFRMFSRGQ